VRRRVEHPDRSELRARRGRRRRRACSESPAPSRSRPGSPARPCWWYWQPSAFAHHGTRSQDAIDSSANLRAVRQLRTPIERRPPRAACVRARPHLPPTSADVHRRMLVDALPIADTEEVTGSIPVSPTSITACQRPSHAVA
jgi:hypothetical protein